MITTNAAWDAKNAGLGKKPIYALSIGGLATVYTTHHLAAEGITGALPAYEAWLKTPRGASQSIDVLNGTSSIGELECEVVDITGSVRELVGTEVLEGRSATLLVGYPGIAWPEFVPLHTYRLYKVTPAKDYTSWMFRSRDRQMDAKRTIYRHPENGELIGEDNPWIFGGTPAEIMQAIYLFALERDPEELDRETLLQLDSAAEGLYKVARPFLLRITESVEAKQFLESEVYKAAGLYPVIDNLGRISLRAFRPPAAGPASVFAFTPDNMILLPEIDRMEICNEIIFRIDHDPDSGEYGNELIFIDADSISAYGRSGQHVIESAGLRSNRGAEWFCEEVADRLFRRFAGTPAGLKGGAPVARIEAFYLTLPVWVGDYVTLTHPKMPNLITGELGVTDRLYEVIDREPDYSSGRMKYRLLDTGLTGLAAAHKWAPSDRNFIIGTSEIY